MHKRDIEQLAICQVDEETEEVDFARLRNIYLDKPSESIYVTVNDKLYGIVCMAEILNCTEEGKVRINRSFKVLTECNLVRAYEIFRRHRSIYKIPVVNKQGELIGDFSRYDDLHYIKRHRELLQRDDILKKILKSYDMIYVIEPNENRNEEYLYLTEYLSQLLIEYRILEKELVAEKISENAICIFLTEDERKSTQCLFRIEPLLYDSWGYDISRYDKLADEKYKMRMATYKSLLIQIKEKIQLEKLEIEKPEDLYRLDDKATILLSALQEKGIKCFCVWSDGNKATKYGQKFSRKMQEKLTAMPLDLKEPWPKKDENEEFYGDLYQLEDYKTGVAQRESYMAAHTFEYEREVSGKYFNAEAGRRKTCFQPQEYTGTIYLLGPCVIIGAYVEDQYTIASCLQKQLLEKGYIYRVENYGGMLRWDCEIDSKLEEIAQFDTNDIVLYLSRVGGTVGIQETSLDQIFETYQIPVEWVVDVYAHCNYKADRLIANSLLEMITPHMQKGLEKHSKKKYFHVDRIMGDYVKLKYLDQYFSDFSVDRYNSIGAVVMSCNPFTRGHRYLIEQARKQVEFLIVFVIEEEEFLFPFEERMQMVEEGTEDISNIMIVPSGDFVLSKNNFVEYFTKRKSGTIALNAEYDANVFADYVAKPLHITHRFVGEEPEDDLGNTYNQIMKKVLHQKGIDLIEIPRMKVGDEVISAFKVLKYLNNHQYDKACRMLLETTKQSLMQQMNFN